MPSTLSHIGQHQPLGGLTLTSVAAGTPRSRRALALIAAAREHCVDRDRFVALLWLDSDPTLETIADEARVCIPIHGSAKSRPNWLAANSPRRQE